MVLSSMVILHLSLSILLLLAKEIIGGMLDLEPRLWRKGIRQNFEEQRKKVLQFAQWWKPYDFTKKKEWEQPGVKDYISHELH